MKALVAPELGRLEVADIRAPSPADLAPTGVLVRTVVSGVSAGTEKRKLFTAELGPNDVRGPWPAIGAFGYMAAGVVDAVGADVTTVAPGDRVYAGRTWGGASRTDRHRRHDRCPPARRPWLGRGGVLLLGGAAVAGVARRRAALLRRRRGRRPRTAGPDGRAAGRADGAPGRRRWTPSPPAGCWRPSSAPWPRSIRGRRWRAAIPTDTGRRAHPGWRGRRRTVRAIAPTCPRSCSRSRARSPASRPRWRSSGRRAASPSSDRSSGSIASTSSGRSRTAARGSCRSTARAACRCSRRRASPVAAMAAAGPRDARPRLAPDRAARHLGRVARSRPAAMDLLHRRPDLAVGMAIAWDPSLVRDDAAASQRAPADDAASSASRATDPSATIAGSSWSAGGVIARW